MSSNSLKYLIFFVVVICNLSGFSQETKRVNLNKAERLLGRKTGNEDLNILVGGVELQHDSSLFFCDSAVMIKLTNSFRAYRHVYIMVNDSVDIFGDSLHYNGNTRVAEIYGEVRLVEKKAVLYTDHLTFDRKTRIAYYSSWGRIVDTTNQLTSTIGYFYSDQHDFFFRKDVILTNPDYILKSDSLKYNTESGIAAFFGPTTIVGQDDSVYSEFGWYNTVSDIVYLKRNSFVEHLEHSIRGDTLYYNKLLEYGWGMSDITITDTLQDVIAKGNYAVYEKYGRFARMTDSAMAIFIDKRDSLFLHADTLLVIFDSTNQTKQINAYNKVKFFRNDLQGACDSLVYSACDSSVNMYKNPVIWSDDNQLTSDSIKMVINNNQIDSMVFYNSCFIIAKDDTSSYNQIKGKNMTGYFKNNELYKLLVFGNSETIYYVREEDGELIGINKAEASNMLIFLEDRKLKTITYMVNPKATLFPEKDIDRRDRILRGFKWHGYNRPEKIADIFEWVEPEE